MSFGRDSSEHIDAEKEMMGGKERREREILKFGISIWHIDKHGVLPTARERERERERDLERDLKVTYIVLARRERE